MISYKLILFCVLLPATRGLSPSFKDRKATRPFDAERRASLMVAAALFVATASPIPSFALTKQDKQDIKQIVTETVTASEKRTNDKITKVVQEAEKRLTNNFAVVPYVSAGISAGFTGVGMLLSSIKLDDAIARSSNKLDDTVARFTDQKDRLKMELQAGTAEEARNGAIVGVALVLIIMGLGQPVNWQ